MAIKFLGISNVSPNTDGAYKLSLLRRLYNFSASGEKVNLPSKAKLNTLIVNVEDETGKAQQREFYFNGNELILSEYQRRQHTAELINAISELGKKAFKEDSELTVSVVGQDKPIKENVYVSESDIYDYHKCPHKVWADAHANPKDMDPPNALMEVLWKRAIQHKSAVVRDMGEHYLNLSEGTDEERTKATLSAMEAEVLLIYKGLLIVDELRADPDILQRQPDGTYIPMDIRAAMAFEGLDEGFDTGKMKQDYAIQLCLYVDALIRLGFATEHKGIILDKDRTEVPYDLDSPRNKRDKTTFWELYPKIKDDILAIKKNEKQNNPAYGSICKLCKYYSAHKEWVEQTNHTSLLYKLGRSFSDKLREDAGIETVRELARVDVNQFMQEKEDRKQAGETFLHGIGEGHLVPLVRRARYMMSGAEGVKILNPIVFPKTPVELHIDIEADPTQDFVYMHGVVIRKVTDKKYHPYSRKDEDLEYRAFVTDEVSEASEEKALREFWNFIRTQKDYTVYHYSHYEKTVYRKLMQKYPDVVSEEELEAFFSPERCVDLYRIVDGDTDWPLSSYSLKEIAKSIGFNWRVEQADTSIGAPEKASGAASIRWFNDWAEAKEAGVDPQVTKNLMQKIKDYNEDDCIATVVLKDYLEDQMQKYIAGLERQMQENKEKSEIVH